MNEPPFAPPVFWWVRLEGNSSSLPEGVAFGKWFRILDLETALQLLLRRRCPHCLFLEGLPDRAGRQALTKLKEAAPFVPVFLVNQWTSADEMQSWMSRHMIEMSQPRISQDFEAPNPYGLSRRELDILRLMVKGLIKKEIAEQLMISYHTVDNHERSIFKKLNVHTRSAAVAKALIEKMC